MLAGQTTLSNELRGSHQTGSRLLDRKKVASCFKLRDASRSSPQRSKISKTRAEAGVIRREVLTPGQRKKFDEAADSQFYSFPRLVKHVDDSFLAAVTRLYRNAVPENGEVLDLMSSWVSHLPEDRKYKRVVGHGMNTVEKGDLNVTDFSKTYGIRDQIKCTFLDTSSWIARLARNKQLDEFFVRDLNKDPSNWSMADCSFDAVLCCVSAQYLQQPEKVFAEIHRILKPGGVCIVTFSNRLYSTKAIQAWRDSPNDYGRIQLVKQYFMCIDGFTTPEALRELPKKVEATGIAKIIQTARELVQRVQQDPFYAVLAYKGSKPKKS